MNILDSILTAQTAFGAFGGATLFLYAFRKGHYKNNQYKVKFLIEVAGGASVATMVGPLFPEAVVIIASYGIGLAWTKIIQAFRNTITKLVQSIIDRDL